MYINELYFRKRGLNLFPNKPFFMCVQFKSLKTLWKKEKLLITRISHFYTVVSILLENFLPFSSHLKLSSANSCNLEESKICRLLKTLWEEEKLLIMSNFSFSHSVFYPFEELSAIFIKFEIVVCNLSISKCLKFVVWERVKTTKQHNLRHAQIKSIFRWKNKSY